MNQFRSQVNQLQLIRSDKREASAEASLSFDDDWMVIYETCQGHADYWAKLAEPVAFGNDWAFPDHPDHKMFLARLRHKQQVQEFKERYIHAERLNNIVNANR
jgi:hypothetical protein